MISWSWRYKRPKRLLCRERGPAIIALVTLVGLLVFYRSTALALLAVPKKLSIVLVTSPIPSNPSTQLLDTVINSFDLIDGLEACRLIIVADGITLREGKRPLWNQGKIDQGQYQKYLQYIKALRSRYEGQGTRVAKVIGPLAKRVNFAHALLQGLEEVETDS